MFSRSRLVVAAAVGLGLAAGVAGWLLTATASHLLADHRKLDALMFQLEHPRPMPAQPAAP